MTAGGWGMRVGVAAALGVDAYVHVALAGAMQIAAPGGIGGGTQFRLQATAAVVAAVYVLAAGSRPAFVFAGLVGLSALVPVVVFSLVEVPAIGPIPSMYDPTWYLLKTLSAVAEGVAVVLVLIYLLHRHRSNPPEPQRVKEAP